MVGAPPFLILFHHARSEGRCAFNLTPGPHSDAARATPPAPPASVSETGRADRAGEKNRKHSPCRRGQLAGRLGQRHKMKFFLPLVPRSRPLGTQVLGRSLALPGRRKTHPYFTYTKRTEQISRLAAHGLETKRKEADTHTGNRGGGGGGEEDGAARRPPAPRLGLWREGFPETAS
jgi:hypothetical protein